MWKLCHWTIKHIHFLGKGFWLSVEFHSWLWSCWEESALVTCRTIMMKNSIAFRIAQQNFHSLFPPDTSKTGQHYINQYDWMTSSTLQVSLSWSLCLSVCLSQTHTNNNICHYLNLDPMKTLLCAFVLSKLYYCNFLLRFSKTSWQTSKSPKFCSQTCLQRLQAWKHQTPSSESSVATNGLRNPVQLCHWKLPSISLWTLDCLISIQTTLLHFWHKIPLHTIHKNKKLWTISCCFSP